MESVQDRLKRLREERAAREKARIDKLRELNLKKYNNIVSQSNSSLKASSQSSASLNRISSAPIKRNNVTTTRKPTESYKATNVNRDSKFVKDIKKTNGENKLSEVSMNVTNKIPTKQNMKVNANPSKSNLKSNIPPLNLKSNNIHKQSALTNSNAFKVHQKSNTTEMNLLKSQNSRKSLAVPSKPIKDSRKSLQPKPQIETKSRESVFDRLYKPKAMPRQSIIDNNAMKLKMDPNYLRQVIRDSNLIINKRHTVFETKEKASVPVRRSISAVHLKRISKSELGNCIQKWASIGEKIHKVHLNEINEDECIKEEKVISAVKSERKRVKFQTPITSNFNTPKPAELQERLQKWLQKRGKSLNSYHHLQCFGLHHLPQNIQSIPNKLVLDVDENKENIALDHDSDNESYTENSNDKAEDQNIEVKNIALDKWRRASYVSDSLGFNETCDTIMSSDELQQDELLTGALNDLSELLREGFDWEQCARWLRAIRERFPEAPDGAAYWECRAALEERRGDLPASVQCWERAIANGTEESVVEANLDQLLDKFMQLKISPSSGRQRVADPKLLDVKNVFKSTIIRFAVQQAKLRQSNGTPRFTVTPVRRSSRLSYIPRTTPLAAPPHSATPINTPRAKTPRSARMPLSLCKSFQQAAELFPVEFKPNKALIQTP